MSNHEISLTKPIEVRDGLSQTKLTIDYIYVHEEAVAIHTKQGNVINIPMTEEIEELLVAALAYAKAGLEASLAK